MKCHEGRHLTFTWLTHYEHEYACVIGIKKTIVTQLRLLQPLGLLTLLHGLCHRIKERPEHLGHLGILSGLTIITSTRVSQLNLFEQEQDLSWL